MQTTESHGPGPAASKRSAQSVQQHCKQDLGLQGPGDFTGQPPLLYPLVSVSDAHHFENVRCEQLCWTHGSNPCSRVCQN